MGSFSIIKKKSIACTMNSSFLKGHSIFPITAMEPLSIFIVTTMRLLSIFKVNTIDVVAY